MNCKKRLLYLLLVIFLFTGCIPEDKFKEPQDIQRTILLYMGGDNNLSSEVNWKIDQIQATALLPCTRILIYMDTRGSHPQLLELVKVNDEIKKTVVHEYEESNSASPEVFGAVLREVQESYPAPSYGLVVFSHASGWLPEGMYNNPSLRSSLSVRSIIIDGKSEMELPDFAAAIPDGMFDFIVFEACYMAGIEVAWELKDKTRYIVASSAEIVSPGFAGCYSKALPYLYQGDLTGFCRAIEADYQTRSGDYGSLTLSLIETKGLDALATALRGKQLQGTSGTIQAFDRYGGNLFFDLGDCYKLEATVQEIAALQAAIDGCVIWKTATTAFMPAYGGFDVVSHSGLTTYIPQEQYPKLNAAYKKMKWYKEVLFDGKDK